MRSMFRRSPLLRQVYRETSRMEQEARQRMLYDEKGNFSYLGYLKLTWSQVGPFAKGTALFLGFVFAYTRIIIGMERKNEKAAVGFEHKREQYLKETGKLKDDRYLVHLSRQIKDPDMDKIPRGQTGTMEASELKLFTDASYSQNGEERRRA